MPCYTNVNCRESKNSYLQSCSVRLSFSVQFKVVHHDLSSWDCTSRCCIWPWNPPIALNLWWYATSLIASMSFESAFLLRPTFSVKSPTYWIRVYKWVTLQWVSHRRKVFTQQGNTYLGWIVRSHWSNQMKGNVFEYIGGIERCISQSLSGSLLAKSKTEIGAMSQRAVNLDWALWEIIAFPFIVVSEMQPSYCYLRKVSRFHFDKICKLIYVEKKKLMVKKNKFLTSFNAAWLFLPSNCHNQSCILLILYFKDVSIVICCRHI